MIDHNRIRKIEELKQDETKPEIAQGLGDWKNITPKKKSEIVQDKIEYD